MQQLVDMGIVIPDEYRADMGMPGAWQTVSQRPVGDGGGPETDVRPGPRSASEKKRKHENDEEEEEDGSTYVQRKGWGSRKKTFPKLGEVDDIDALLGAPIQLKRTGATGKQDETEISPSGDGGDDGDAKTEAKMEEADHISRTSEADGVVDKIKVPKVEPEADDPISNGIVFKKRKSKLAKEKTQA
jgi:hypothetical protein